MYRMLNNLFRRAHSSQMGQALLLTMLFMLLGSTMIIPLLSFMMTGAKTSRVYENKTDSLYAADSGIELAKWMIKNEHMDLLEGYSFYNFDDQWVYDSGDQVNGRDVNITIENEWIPTFNYADYGVNVEDIATQEKLLVIGNASGTTYTIKLAYTWEDEDERDSFKIKTIGVWLPSGFTYRGDSHCNLGSTAAQYKDYYCTASVSPHASGTALVWNFGETGYRFIGSSSLHIDPLPGVIDINDPTITAEITFEFTPDVLQSTPDAVAWATTSLTDVPYAWDANKKVFKIISKSDGTEIHAYVAKSETRDLQAAFNGDYVATGQSLLIDDNNQAKYRDILLKKSSSTVTSLPENARVELAYLYWSGWVRDKANGVFWDYCGPRSLDILDENCNWIKTGDDWIVEKGTQGSDSNSYTEKFKGRHVSGSDNNRYLTLKDSLDLSGISGATVSWTQEVQSNAGSKVYEDTCSLTRFNNHWIKSTNTYWSFHDTNNDRYRARNGTGSSSESDRSLTHYEDLSSYNSSQTLTLSWNYWSDNISSSQGVDVSITSDGENYTRIAFFRDDRDSGAPPVTYDLDPSYFTADFAIKFELIGTSYSSNRYCYIDNIKITATYPDQLYIDFSNDGGTTWPLRVPASGEDVSIPIPPAYLTDNFKMRLYLDGFNDDTEYVRIDDILISDNSLGTHVDSKVTFTVNDHTETLTADPEDTHFAQVLSGGTTPDGWYYACRKEVTDLIRYHSDGVDLDAVPIAYGNGNGTYTVGDMYADTKSVMNPGRLADSGYAGWSLIIIYSSPDTRGHQLYLYDTFRSVPNNQGNSITEISGFIVPEQIEGEGSMDDVAKFTIFVGEGDEQLSPDWVKFIGPRSTSAQLSDGFATGNVLNSKSQGLSAAGIDIDTFHIKWGDNLLEPGDTSAGINIYTDGDGYVFIYLVLSFRSQSTIGGALSYLVQGN